MIRQNKTSYNNLQTKRPKSLTLNIEPVSARNVIKGSFPGKKYSQMVRGRKYSSYVEQAKSRKSSQCRKRTLEVDSSSLKQILNMKVFQAVFKDTKVQTPKTPKVSFKHKFKYKLLKAAQSQKTNPTSSLQINQESVKNKTTISKCFVFNTEPDFSQREQTRIAKSPEVCIRTSNGSNKKFDSYMYLKKMKAKTDSRLMTEVRGDSVLKQKTNRQLYIMRRDSSRTKSYINTCFNMRPNKRSKQRRLKTQKQEYRPWSAGKSQYQD